MFGLPGDQTMHALDALYDEPSIQFVTTRHEQGTTYLADGYARGGGRPGVAFVVPGVGIYNAGRGPGHRVRVVLPRRADRRARSTGPASARHLGLLHEIDDQLDLVRPITSWQRRALHRRRDPRHRARGVRTRAARAAAAGRDRDAAGGVLRNRRRRAVRPGRERARRRRPRARSPRAADLARRRRATVDLGRWRCRARRRHRRARRAWPSSCRRRWSRPVRARAASTPATRSTRARRGSTSGCSRSSTTPTWCSRSAPISSATGSPAGTPVVHVDVDRGRDRHPPSRRRSPSSATPRPRSPLLLAELRARRDPAADRGARDQAFRAHRRRVAPRRRAAGDSWSTSSAPPSPTTACWCPAPPRSGT